jgi:ABC-type multidrug transport system ATPase subunit
MSESTKGLYVQHMSFSFLSQEKPFFENVSLHCLPGTLNFLQGKNGSGKSTFFNILQATIPQGARLTGNFMIDGQEMKPEYITMVVQDVDEMIVPQFSVEQNMQCANLPHHPGLRNLPETHNIAMLQEFNIDSNKRVDELSGGQKQILAIVMASQKPTKLLLLDEPTAALDPKNANMVMQCLQKLAQDLGITVLIISHDKELVMAYAPGYYFEITQDDNDMRSIEKITFLQTTE